MFSSVDILAYLGWTAEVIFGFLGCADLGFSLTIKLLKFGASFNFTAQRPVCVVKKENQRVMGINGWGYVLFFREIWVGMELMI